jgi:hypothetical protein
MIIVMFVLAGVSFAIGVLIGSALHANAVDRRYRQLAVLVRQLHEQEEILGRVGYPTLPHGEYPRQML